MCIQIGSKVVGWLERGLLEFNFRTVEFELCSSPYSAMPIFLLRESRPLDASGHRHELNATS